MVCITMVSIKYSFDGSDIWLHKTVPEMVPTPSNTVCNLVLF